ncbi:MAG: 3-deoxy-7-phosphoheptulonate synthase [Halobacteriovoraceae bacterium]|nr:3-deoxy-7-phosphoheptulonate synthase [Halobacteriovoraceae bacterium]
MKITPINQWLPFKDYLVIAGPCSAETESQVLSTAHSVKKIDRVKIFRAGVWKPRTRPNTFEGIGLKGLKWLQKVKKETGLLTCTEVANPEHIKACIDHDIDILWVGARTTVNPFLIQNIADSLEGKDIPVMIKNPINADISLWVGAIERFLNKGITKLVGIHRGFSTARPSPYRNEPCWKIPIEIRQKVPGLPLICDPSHIAGSREKIFEVSQKAFDIAMEGLMIETHPDPDKALSDRKQQVTPNQLEEILKGLQHRKEFCSDELFDDKLSSLRSKIDALDKELLDILKVRMNIVHEIGQEKIKKNIAALQKNRLDQLIDQRVIWGNKLNLPEDYVDEVFQIIHAASVKTQTQLME